MGQGIEFDIPGLQQDLFDDRHDIVILESSIRCPVCINEDPLSTSIQIDGRPGYIKKFACPVCQGNSYIYRNARAVRGLVTQIRNINSKELQDLGYVEPGDSVFSPEFAAGFINQGDRITFTNPTSVEDQVIMRGAANIGENIAFTTDLAPNEDRLWYLPQVAIWCEDENGVTYFQNTDFTFQDKKIVWINSPNPGTIYTLKYRNYAEWIVHSGTMERFDRGRNLAQKVLLKKKHVYFFTGSQAASPGQRTAEQESYTTVNGEE